MSRWLRFIPHERKVSETEEEIRDGLFGQGNQETQLIYKDEAERSFWDFFDEYEFRSEKPEKIRFTRKLNISLAERRLLTKLDILITIYGLIGYWCKFFDNANLNNAYVSGLQEDIGMKGNDLINTQVLYNVGAIIFTLPFMFILPRAPSTYVLFIGEFLWSTFTMATAGVNDVKALKAFRFIVGAAETSFFPVIHYNLTSWYKPYEISKRAGLFYVGQYLGVLTSGLLQASIYDLLNGVNGLAGWRWVFLINGVMSYAICLIGLYCIPGTPFKCYSLFLTDEEIKLARKRMRLNGTDDGEHLNAFFDKNTWINMIKSWHFWIFSFGNIGGFVSSNSSSGSFALWLKSLNRYSVGELNNLTAIPPALGIVWLLIATFGADFTRKRFLMIIFVQFMNLIGNVILAIWDVPELAKWFAFYFSYWAWSQSSVFYPLMNDILRHDANLRSIEWVISYIIGYQAFAWISKIVWETEEAPRFHKGFTTAGIFGMVQAVFMAIGYFFYKHSERNNARANGVVLYNSKRGEDIPTGSPTDSIEPENLEDRKVNIRTYQDSLSD